MFEHLAFFIEGGPVKMTRPSDDTYYEAQVNGREEIDFRSLALGLGARVSLNRVRVEIGARTLGEQRMRTDIIDDGQYFACAAAHTCKGIAPTQFWTCHGRTDQAYVSAGYAFRLGGVDVVPAFGIAETRLTWSYSITYLDHPEYNTDPGTVKGASARTIIVPRYFVGVSVEWSRVGLGLFWLDTAPTRSVAVDPSYAGQGDGALYLRATVRL